MSKRILIVDDSSIIRRNLRRTLESVDDWQVTEAVNGREGIEKAYTLRPDLIVLDLSMPVLNGLDAARALHRTMPEIPLMLYSLHADHHLEKQARAIGIQSVLSKSVDTETLLHEARTLLSM